MQDNLTINIFEEGPGYAPYTSGDGYNSLIQFDRHYLAGVEGSAYHSARAATPNGALERCLAYATGKEPTLRQIMGGVEDDKMFNLPESFENAAFGDLAKAALAGEIPGIQVVLQPRD
jgi:hypothetical protein